jgi:hypothetical protein
VVSFQVGWFLHVVCWVAVPGIRRLRVPAPLRVAS